MKHTGYLFSFSALALSVGTMGFFALDKSPTKTDIVTEPRVELSNASIPPMETPVVIELPDTPAVKAELPKVKPTFKRAKVALNVAAPPREKEMVCGEWKESAYGGRVRACEMK